MITALEFLRVLLSMLLLRFPPETYSAGAVLSLPGAESALRCVRPVHILELCVSVGHSQVWTVQGDLTHAPKPKTQPDSTRKKNKTLFIGIYDDPTCISNYNVKRCVCWKRRFVNRDRSVTVALRDRTKCFTWELL
ncbi:hypothetical protein NL108_010017 [Boleophthalmus pectinirostris]|nr:hypothetical protein NL108_010017 [Boleophthalmus pectinirostris]